jgi:hypothetical protein
MSFGHGNHGLSLVSTAKRALRGLTTKGRPLRLCREGRQLLDVTGMARSLAMEYYQAIGSPAKARIDALHMGVATWHRNSGWI